MRNILEEIAGRTRERVKAQMEVLPLEEVRAMAWERVREGKEEGSLPAFEKRLARPGMQYICEVKKASPSKGLIAPDFPYLDIAREYEEAGAAAISCLTEPYYFQGSDVYLEEIAGAVSIPVLRKDFTVHEYMVYQAKALGAGAVLLIAALLEDGQLKEWGALAKELGLSALYEAHDERELERCLDAGARVIGVNNRDLRTFTVDVGNSIRLRHLAPENTLFVSESGIRTQDDIGRLLANRVDAVLIGETLMRSRDKRSELERLNGGRLA